MHLSVPTFLRSQWVAPRLRRVSGKVAAAWLVICLFVTAVLIPMALRTPRLWIEFEIVLLVWWISWFRC